MKKFAIWALSSALMLGSLAGCTAGGKNDPGPAGEGSTAEAGSDTNNTPKNQIFFYTAANHLYEDEDTFERLIGQFIRKKFPDYELKHVQWDDGTRYEDLIAKKTIPDIVVDGVRRNTARMIKKFGMEYDMTDLIKKYNFDTSRIEPADLQIIKNASDGKMYSLPLEQDDFVLAYNKDIFDKFGLEYPKPGWTYDEAYELAKKLTRQDGDVTYKGYQQHPSHYSMYNQLSEPQLSLTEDKATMTTDNWVKIVNNIRRFYEIPGNQFTTTSDFPKGQMGIAVDTLENVVNWAVKYPNLHFEIGTVPVFPEAPKTRYEPSLNGMFITKQSNKKDVAFQVIQYLLSDEVQEARSKEGVISPIKGDAIKKAFGQNIPQLRDKKVENIFYLDPAVPKPRKPGLIFINPDTWTIYKQYIFEESKDTATALRLDEELMNQHIMETKAAIEAGGDGTTWQ